MHDRHVFFECEIIWIVLGIENVSSLPSKEEVREHGPSRPQACLSSAARRFYMPISIAHTVRAFRVFCKSCHSYQSAYSTIRERLAWQNTSLSRNAFTRLLGISYPISLPLSVGSRILKITAIDGDDTRELCMYVCLQHVLTGTTTQIQ